MPLTSFPADGLAVVIGATGGIGSAVHELLAADLAFDRVLALSRSSNPPLDLRDEASIAAAADAARADGGNIRLVFDATGFLHDDGHMPEKALSAIEPEALMHNFALNAVGPALLMKHFLPLLPRTGKSVFATISAKVGSIADNQLGGWYGYRAAKAAQNQFLRTAAIELARRKPEAICVALHPGTVATALSEPFSRSGSNILRPGESAAAMLNVLDGLTANDTGQFRAYSGQQLPW